MYRRDPNDTYVKIWPHNIFLYGLKHSTFNICLVLEIPKNVTANELLSDTHKACDLREWQKQAAFGNQVKIVLEMC